MMDSFCVHLKDVTHEIHGVPLFAPVSFALRAGQIALVKGDNGAGKSTLLRMIAGLLPVATGGIHHAFNPPPPPPSAIHFLGHGNGLKDDETVAQTLGFWRRMSPLTGAAATPLDGIASGLGLSRLLSLPVKVLSAGQKRRLAFARLLLDERPLWLLDEPTASLDAASRETVEAITGDYLANGGVVIAATHMPFLEHLPDAMQQTVLLARPSDEREGPQS